MGSEIALSLEFNSIVLRLLFAMLAGTMIGMDRSSKGRGAGVKTHSLVCVGATLVMLISQYMKVAYHNEGDLARLGAQVISGMGFLGVGTIIVTGRNHVKGLTTAAGLWVCACVGLAIGIGFWQGAVVTLVIIMFILRVLSALDMYMHRYVKNFELYIEFNAASDIRRFMEDMGRQNAKLGSVEVTKSRIDGSRQAANVGLEMGRAKDRPALVEWIRDREYVLYLEEV